MVVAPETPSDVGYAGCSHTLDPSRDASFEPAGSSIGVESHARSSLPCSSRPGGGNR